MPMERWCGQVALVLVAALLTVAPGCERKPKPASATSGPGTTAVSDTVALPAVKPEYSFAPGVMESQPEIAAFVRQFLETALVGDYAGYRRLVARSVGRGDPEPRARFEKVLGALRKLEIESIEPVEVRSVPGPAYLVISQADVDPKQGVALRGGANRRVAILVVQEEGEWRMAPAPADLQPRDMPVATTGEATQPAETAPSYAWDKDVDY